MMRGRLSMKELTPLLGGGRAGFSLWRGWLWLWLACGMVLPALTQERPDIVWIRGGHTHEVTSVSFSPDGRLLASGSWDKTIKLWRVADGALVRTLTGHTRWVESVSFSPDGRLLASGGGDETIKLWRVADGSLVRTLRRHAWQVNSVVFSPDGRLLASGGQDYTIKLWRVSDGSLVRTLTGHSPVNSVSFSPDGRLLASGSRDNTIKLWRVSDGSLVRTLRGHTSFVTSVSFSPDGRLLASGSWDGTIRLWRVADGALRQTYNQEIFGAFSIQFSSDGRLFGYGRADATVVVARNPFWQRGEGNPQPKNVKPPRGNTPPQRRHDKTDLRAGLSVRRGRTAGSQLWLVHAAVVGAAPHHDFVDNHGGRRDIRDAIYADSRHGGFGSFLLRGSCADIRLFREARN